jgi:AraC-like DNA-binding protein
MQFVRSACLGVYDTVATAAGLDSARMLKAVGIDLADLRDPNTPIEVEAVRRLLEDSARLSGVIDFGLRMAERSRLSTLGPIGLALREEPSVRKALDCLSHYLRLHNQGLRLWIEEEDGVAVLHLELVIPTQAPARQGTELTLAVLRRIMGLFLGPSWNPESVCFAHAAPASTVSHHRIFNTRLEFGCAFDGIVCSSNDLDTVNLGADPALTESVKRQLDSMLAVSEENIVDELRVMAYMLLPMGQCRADIVARQLGLDRRTVGRHLARYGESYSSVIGQVRAQLAIKYLRGGNHTVSEVADLLGFSALSAFSRWFHGRFGCCPTCWRDPEAPRRSGQESERMI